MVRFFPGRVLPRLIQKICSETFSSNLTHCIKWCPLIWGGVFGFWHSCHWDESRGSRNKVMFDPMRFFLSAFFINGRQKGKTAARPEKTFRLRALIRASPKSNQRRHWKLSSLRREYQACQDLRVNPVWLMPLIPLVPLTSLETSCMFNWDPKRYEERYVSFEKADDHEEINKAFVCMYNSPSIRALSGRLGMILMLV